MEKLLHFNTPFETTTTAKRNRNLILFVYIVLCKHKNRNEIDVKWTTATTIAATALAAMCRMVAMGANSYKTETIRWESIASVETEMKANSGDTRSLRSNCNQIWFPFYCFVVVFFIQLLFLGCFHRRHFLSHSHTFGWPIRNNTSAQQLWLIACKLEYEKKPHNSCCNFYIFVMSLSTKNAYNL